MECWAPEEHSLLESPKFTKGVISMRNTLTGTFILAAWLALPVSGQTVGDITGVVSDASGGVVVNATVTVTNPQTNFTRTAITNTAGNYNFPALQPGVYNVKAEAPGFRTDFRESLYRMIGA